MEGKDSLFLPPKILEGKTTYYCGGGSDGDRMTELLFFPIFQFSKISPEGRYNFSSAEAYKLKLYCGALLRLCKWCFFELVISYPRFSNRPAYCPLWMDKLQNPNLLVEWKLSSIRCRKAKRKCGGSSDPDAT